MQKINAELGRLIARVLIGNADSSSLSSVSADDLMQVAPLLLKSGGGAMGWWSIRQSSLRDTQAAHEFHQAYRLHTLQAALKEQEIGQVFSFLRSRGLEPLMGKGWVIARHYHERGLRPYGDIDLYVRKEQHHDYAAALKMPEAEKWNVDLHQGASELDDRSFDELDAHSQSHFLGKVEVKTFGPEDHLRLLCLHFLREGALRPLWLLDIAVALNSLPLEFDWGYFLSGNRQRSDWAVCAMGLAHYIFGARIEGLPVAGRAMSIPSWLVPAVLQQWGAGRTINGRRQAVGAYLWRPAQLIEALRLRWPNPIEATFSMRGPFNEWPRLPFQIGACIVRTAGFARNFSRLRHGTPNANFFQD